MRRNRHAATMLVVTLAVAFLGLAVLIGRGVWHALVSTPRPPSLTVAVPATLTTPDGLRYSLITQKRFSTGGQRSLAFTVNPGASRVLAVRAFCALAPVSDGHSTMELLITGKPAFYAGDPAFNCANASANLHEFTVDQLPRSGPMANIQLVERRSIFGQSPPTPAMWLFAVYLRDNTAQAQPPRPVMLPERIYDDSDVLSRVRTVSGVWPRQRSAHLTLEKASAFTIVVGCSPAMAGRSSVVINGQDAGPCPAVDGDERPLRIRMEGNTGHVTVTFSVADADAGHLGSWTVGVYREDP